ncbi:retrovirus-related Pol polyprotein from transposon TNT 1-94 [Pyrus ussuriensis x Pyrus communis]|uniref:Retrovirus-related Pol polyprotein from transposon TNT 1-94 n=1 Tax=Pyrus ussuriensis x Pyrus communis TaxID=2448454 RepID=A0A5N5IAD4_9ROSA|nr:retrovirus-related Pol polyprotein from transposon TNT 1-94 [Pyrus ussuriensis x Pyrus communis]
MGYGSCEKGYRIYNLQTKKIILSRSVIFDESKSWNWESKQEETVFMPLSFENENPEITEPEGLIHETQSCDSPNLTQLVSCDEHVTGSNNGSTSQAEKLGGHLCKMSYDYY